MTPALFQTSSLLWLDYLGIAVFAISGALVAAAKQQNLVTFAFFAVVTGVGGGTLRDLLIGAPVFWVSENTVLLVCMAGAAGVWFFARRPMLAKAILWFDAVGLAVYAVYGADKALRYGLAPVPAVLMGVMTACAGGITRDLLAGEPSILLRPEVYVVAAVVSAGLYTVLSLLGLSPGVAAFVAGLLGFALRGGAIRFGLQLPNFRGAGAG